MATPDDVARQQQECLAGTVSAAGAGLMEPDQGPHGLLAGRPPLFTVLVNEDESTFGPAPQLREAFALLDEHRPVTTHQMITVGTAWAVMAYTENPLVKLKLEFQRPMRGNAGIVLIANKYVHCWPPIVHGGMIRHHQPRPPGTAHHLTQGNVRRCPGRLAPGRHRHFPGHPAPDGHERLVTQSKTDRRR